MPIENKYTRKNINPRDYVNINTGESLSDEHPDTTSIMVMDGELKIISSDEYVILDSKAFRYIQKTCSKADIEKIHRMSDMTWGSFNILYDKDGTAHTRQTLRRNLEYDESEFSRFMKRLYTKSIIYYLDGYKNDRKCKHIMLNPTLCRKRKSFHKDCLSVFDDLSKKGNVMG